MASVRGSLSRKVLQGTRRWSSDLAAEAKPSRLVDKWKAYWNNVYADYKEVAVGLVEDSRRYPARAVAVASGLGFLGYCFATNPDEVSFREAVLRYSNDMGYLAPPIRNPESLRHLQTLETSYSCGTVRRSTLGVFSIIWLADYDRLLGHYKATCGYMKPSYLGFYRQVVDIGFMNRWWIIRSKMKDFDVNPEEWGEK